MVKAALLFSTLIVSACTSPSFREPIAPVPRESAVRANMAAHIIDPNPPSRSALRVDAQRAVLATERYRTGKVEKPGEEAPRSLTGAGE